MVEWFKKHLAIEPTLGRYLQSFHEVLQLELHLSFSESLKVPKHFNHILCVIRNIRHHLFHFFTRLKDDSLVSLPNVLAGFLPRSEGLTIWHSNSNLTHDVEGRRPVTLKLISEYGACKDRTSPR